MRERVVARLDGPLALVRDSHRFFQRQRGHHLQADRPVHVPEPLVDLLMLSLPRWVQVTTSGIRSPQPTELAPFERHAASAGASNGRRRSAVLCNPRDCRVASTPSSRRSRPVERDERAFWNPSSGSQSRADHDVTVDRDVGVPFALRERVRLAKELGSVGDRDDLDSSGIGAGELAGEPITCSTSRSTSSKPKCSANAHEP